MNGIAVVLIILRRVNAALGSHGVRTPWRVMEYKVVNFVSQLSESRRGRRPGKSGSDHDHLVLTLIRGIDELGGKLMFLPL